jgi:hypothetical protein
MVPTAWITVVEVLFGNIVEPARVADWGTAQAMKIRSALQLPRSRALERVVPQFPRIQLSGSEARTDFLGRIAARLKSCPCKTLNRLAIPERGLTHPVVVLR